MYLAHFNLSTHPFRPYPQANFFFAGARRGEILAALRYAIQSGKGLMTVTGETGSGKTMLCQMLAEQSPTEIVAVSLGGPGLIFDDLLQAIANNLGTSFEEIRPTARIRILQKLLVEHHMAGKQVAILIDDAHAIPDKTLEEIRQLSSLNRHHHTLLQIILFGLPTLNERLLNPSLRQLRERIAFRFELGPFNASDTAAYIDWRLRTAGQIGTSPFSTQALRLISRASAGNLHRINMMANKSLQSACGEGNHAILARHTRSAIENRSFTLRSSLLQLMSGLALVSSLFLGLIWILLHTGKTPDTLQAAPTNIAVQRPASTPHTQSLTAEPMSSAPAIAPAASALSPITLSRRRLDAAPAGALAIMIGAADKGHWTEIETLYSTLLGQLPEEQVLILPARLNGRMGWGVFYGFFQDRIIAGKVLANLPEVLRKNHPFIRTVEGMKNELNTLP